MSKKSNITTVVACDLRACVRRFLFLGALFLAANGELATHLYFAVIDVPKKQDLANNKHSSKNIVLPLVVERRLELLAPEKITDSPRTTSPGNCSARMPGVARSSVTRGCPGWTIRPTSSIRVAKARPGRRPGAAIKPSEVHRQGTQALPSQGLNHQIGGQVENKKRIFPSRSMGQAV